MLAISLIFFRCFLRVVEVTVLLQYDKEQAQLTSAGRRTFSVPADLLATSLRGRKTFSFADLLVTSLGVEMK